MSLKPCPYCYSERVTRAIYCDQHGIHIVALCRDCEASGPMYLFSEDGVTRAREAWNAGCEPGNTRYLISKRRKL